MRHFLVVDDSKIVHNFVISLLKDYPIMLTHVYNGEEAVKYISNGGEADLILMDWEMPVMEGPEASYNIRKHGFSGPILMITTRNKPEDIKLALDKGVSDFMMKPYTKEILIEKIEHLDIAI